jgi:F0F1-type ATP synthase membrane subunit c/vacuolar-type H+-ATPase subunit K
MFAYMFGDVGHGAVLLIAGLILSRCYPALRLLVYGGGMSVIFGFLFGSVFSLETLIEPIWVNPLEDPILILIVPMVGGAMLLLVGMLLDALQSFWSRKGREWWETGAGLMLCYVSLLAAVIDVRWLWASAVCAVWFVVGHAFVVVAGRRWPRNRSGFVGTGRAHSRPGQCPDYRSRRAGRVDPDDATGAVRVFYEISAGRWPAVPAAGAAALVPDTGTRETTMRLQKIPTPAAVIFTVLNAAIIVTALFAAARGFAAEPVASVPPEVVGWGMVAAAIAAGLSAVGAAYAVAHVGSSAVGALAEKPELLGRVLIFVGLAEGIAIYGLIIAILILNRLG